MLSTNLSAKPILDFRHFKLPSALAAGSASALIDRALAQSVRLKPASIRHFLPLVKANGNLKSNFVQACEIVKKDPKNPKSKNSL
jgi:hypothetical protein